jgi:hypothetical protein
MTRLISYERYEVPHVASSSLTNGRPYVKFYSTFKRKFAVSVRQRLRAFLVGAKTSRRRNHSCSLSVCCALPVRKTTNNRFGEYIWINKGMRLIVAVSLLAGVVSSFAPGQVRLLTSTATTCSGNDNGHRAPWGWVKRLFMFKKCDFIEPLTYHFLL